MILPVAYDVFVNQVSSFTPKGYICQWTQCGAAATARRVRVLSTAGRTRRKRCYRHLVCCMTGLGYNPHTFSIIHNQPKAPLEDEGQEIMFMKHLFTMLLALIAATASAQAFEKGGIYYRVLSEDDRTVEVISGADEYKGDIVIPEEVIYDSKVYLVTTIGDYAFYLCDALTSVSMPSVTTIGDGAFNYCEALTSVHIPASCTSIAGNPFPGCESLEEIVVDENNPNYSSMDGVLYDKYMSTLIACPGKKSSIDMSSSVTTIGDGAFYACRALTSVHIPESCTSIVGNPFQKCESLEEIVVDENNPNYSSMDGVLYDKYMSTLIACPGKKSSIDMSSSVTTIGDGAFSFCRALTSVSMPSVTTIGEYAFYRCYALTSVSMPSVTTIGKEAFMYCDALTSVSMPSVTTIGEEAFYACHALASVSMPSVTTIGYGAFSSCDGLTSVSMPSVTTIGDGAFWYCSALTSVDIPASVSTIGIGAFDRCSSLTSVYCHWVEPLECDPWFTDEVLENAILFVPRETVDAYRSVKPWSDFANIVEARYSGIADTPGSGLSVKVIDGVIVVEGGDSTASAPVVEVYSAGGVCVYRGTDSSIGGLPRGVYVVKVGGTVQKVAL